MKRHNGQDAWPEPQDPLLDAIPQKLGRDIAAAYNAFFDRRGIAHGVWMAGSLFGNGRKRGRPRKNQEATE